MFEYDSEIIKALHEEPDQIWFFMDSFWRDQTTVDTRDLTKFQTYAALTLFCNLQARADHFLRTQTVPIVQEFMRQPWFPLVIFADQVVDQDFVTYGEGFIYDSPPQILYGEQSGTSRYLVRLPQELCFVADVPELVDQVTNTQVVIDNSQYGFNPATGELVFTADPFTLVESKTAADSGEEYIVLWIRNGEFDLNVAFDQIGWVVKYDRVQLLEYANTLQNIWELVLLGPSIERYQEGMMKAMGFPYAEFPGLVTRVENDGWRDLITIEGNGQAKTYGVVDSKASPIVTMGDTVKEGQPLTDGIKFFEYPGILSATIDEIPGLLFQVPLSTGKIAELTFANVDTVWEFVAARPSEWRFPVGGYAPDVEQFWVDVDAYATANGIDFATLYGLPAPVNPMERMIEDLIHTNVYVSVVELANIIREDPGAFHDRAKLLLPPGTFCVLQQNVGDISDVYDLGTETSDTVGYGYNAAVPTDTISIPGGGTALTYFDYAPLVVSP